MKTLAAPGFIFLAALYGDAIGREINPEKALALDCELVAEGKTSIERHILLFMKDAKKTIHAGPDGKGKKLGSGGRSDDRSSYLAIDMTKDDPVVFFADTKSGFADLRLNGDTYTGECKEFTRFFGETATPEPTTVESISDCDQFTFPFMKKSCQVHFDTPWRFRAPCEKAGFRIGWHSMTECIASRARIAVSAGLFSESENRSLTSAIQSGVGTRASSSQKFFSPKAIELTFKNGFLGDRYTGSVGEDGSTRLKNRDTGERLRGTFSSSGDIRLKDDNGNVFRGSVDESGRGRLKDSTGNTYRIKPD